MSEKQILKLHHQLLMKLIIVSITLLLCTSLYSQKIGIGANLFDIDNSSILEIQSTNKGVLMPRMTELERDSMCIGGAECYGYEPAHSLVIYNLDKDCFEFWAYDAWHRLACMCPLIGDEYEGGIIAYVFKEADPGFVAGECHGIIAAASDLANSTWSNITGTAIGTTNNEIGEGKDNTDMIIAQGGHTSSAAKNCDDLVLNDYTDWFLPSIDELEKLYDSNDIIGGFNTTAWVGEYWSSSEHQGGNASTHAQYIQMWDGVKMALNKSQSLKVRCVRYF